MTNWEKGKPARNRRSDQLRHEMELLIARIKNGEDLRREFHELYQTARRYISHRDGLGCYYVRFLEASKNIAH